MPARYSQREITSWIFTKYLKVDNEEEIVKNLSKIDGAEIVLYANWKYSEYDITYHYNGGKENPDLDSNPISYNISILPIKLNNDIKNNIKGNIPITSI